VLVEGKRDIHALRNSHFYKGEIIQISNRKPHELAQLLLGTEKTVVMLTDYDAAGEQLLERFADELSANNITVDVTTRKSLRWILGINTIEEISTAYADFVARVTCAQHELCLTEELLIPIRNEGIMVLNKYNSRVR
ncbi:MAG: hypothetical protein QW783_03895, partial [Candidatus Micrarchaeia archaeon]